MPTYKVRIKPGMKHGAKDEHLPGDVLIVGEVELDSFGDKFEVLEPLPDQPTSPETEDAEDVDPETVELAPEVEAALAKIEAMFGQKFVEEDRIQTLEELQARVKNGEVPKLTEVVGPSLTAKLHALGYGDPVIVFYASDQELLDVDGLGPGTLAKLREVYGKEGD